MDAYTPIVANETEKLKLEDCREVSRTCLAMNLRRVDRVVMQFYDEAFRPLGLRGTQFSLLVAARAMEPVGMSDLAAQMAMDRTTLTRNLKPMTKQRWLKVETGDDRRERKLSLTPLGNRLLVKAHARWKKAQDEIKSRFGRQHAEDLVGRLSAFSAMARER